jgi:hypothetical protein
MLLQLNAIECYEDSSTGTTQWIFSVLAGPQLAFQIPNRRYGDKPTPMVYKMTPADRASASIRVDPKDSVALRVIGYKPKNLSRSSVR